jgi:hypothetical protein
MRPPALDCVGNTESMNENLAKEREAEEKGEGRREEEEARLLCRFFLVHALAGGSSRCTCQTFHCTFRAYRDSFRKQTLTCCTNQKCLFVTHTLAQFKNEF